MAIVLTGVHGGNKSTAPRRRAILGVATLLIAFLDENCRVGVMSVRHLDFAGGGDACSIRARIDVAAWQRGRKTVYRACSCCASWLMICGNQNRDDYSPKTLALMHSATR